MAERRRTDVHHSDLGSSGLRQLQSEDQTVDAVASGASGGALLGTVEIRTADGSVGADVGVRAAVEPAVPSRLVLRCSQCGTEPVFERRVAVDDTLGAPGDLRLVDEVRVRGSGET